MRSVFRELSGKLPCTNGCILSAPGGMLRDTVTVATTAGLVLLPDVYCCLVGLLYIRLWFGYAGGACPGGLSIVLHTDRTQAGLPKVSEGDSRTSSVQISYGYSNWLG